MPEDSKLRQLLNGILEELVEENRVKRTDEGLYVANVSANANVLIGKVEHVNKNYAFVVSTIHQPTIKPKIPMCG
ncbi:MAG: hypothetical protein R2822_16755 [Spirosomataceae bacterium]